MTDDDFTPEQIAQWNKEYFEEVDALEEWYATYWTPLFDHVRRGSGDTFMDLDHLADRIKSETIEGVAHGGMPDGMLYQDDYIEKYAEVCDVVERTFQRMPLDQTDDNPFMHTSKEARAGAMRIFKILGVESAEY